MGLDLHQLGPEQTTALIIVTVAAITASVIAVTAIIATCWSHAVSARARAALTQQMIERGFTPEEIAAVLAQHGEAPEPSPEGSVALPHASEAVVADDDGEWHQALVLQAAPGRYYVHYVGAEMDENEWVPEGRIRFPSGSPLPPLAASLAPSDPTNGAPRKPPAEVEL